MVPTESPRASSVMTFLKAIERWEHWKSIQRLAEKEYGISALQFEHLLPEYQRFLALLTVAEGGLALCSISVDKLWHAHILSTRLYETFCSRFFQRMIHHTPNLDQETRSDQGECICKPSCNTPQPNCDECGTPEGDWQPSPHRVTAFITLYTAISAAPPPAVWNLPEADGIATR